MGERRNIMLGTAGHVDHGKTALVRLLTGCDTDRLAEEKRRGLTIELGFAPCRMADERIVGIVDVPGHESFIRNMAAGAHGVDVVILVVAADDGVMPQTREHLDILTLLGARHGLVALTKTDLVDAELLGLATGDVRGFLAGTFLDGAPICPVSNVTGEGFDAFFRALNDVCDSVPGREPGGVFRLWCERAFSIKGFGTVVSGVPTAGRVRVGDRLWLNSGDRAAPSSSGERVRIRGIEVYGQEADEGRAGECVALNIADANPQRLPRGSLLCGSAAVGPSSFLACELHVLERLPHGVRDQAAVQVHVGTAVVAGGIALLEIEHKGELGPGASGWAQLRLARPIPAVPGDRFVVRGQMAELNAGQITTLGGGRVLATGDRRLRRNRPSTLAQLRRRAETIDDPERWVETHLLEAGDADAGQAGAAAPGVVTIARASDLALATPDETDRMLTQLAERGAARRVEGGYLHANTVAAAAEKVLAALAEFHDLNPRRRGPTEAELFAAIKSTGAAAAPAIADLIERGAVTRHGDVLSLTCRSVSLGEDDRASYTRVEAALRDGGVTVPSLQEIAAGLGETAERVAAIADLLVDDGVAVRLGQSMVMHAEAVARARQVVLDLFAGGSGFSTAEFRDALGVTRKHALPLLDHFDRVRLSVRSGSRRTPGAEAKRALGR